MSTQFPSRNSLIERLVGLQGPALEDEAEAIGGELFRALKARYDKTPDAAAESYADTAVADAVKIAATRLFGRA